MNKEELRSKIIETGLKNGNSAHAIERTLSSHNLGGYNPLATKEYYKYLGSRVWPNAKEVARDAITLGGQMIKPFADIVDKNKTIKQVLSDKGIQNTLKGAVAGGAIGSKIGPLGATGGALIGGLIGNQGIKNFTNSLLGTYNLSTENFTGKGIDPRDIAQGIAKNPVYAAGDFLTLGGGKIFKGGINKIGDTIPKDAPVFIRQILPNTEQRALNRRITEGVGNARTKTGKNYNAFTILEGNRNINRGEVARHIITGESSLKGKDRTLAEGLRDSLGKNTQLGIDMGLLEADEARKNVISQYVMNKLGIDEGLRQLDINSIIDNKDLLPKAKEIIDSKNLSGKIADLIKEGAKKYDDGSISYLTQKFAGKKDPWNEVIGKNINKNAKDYFDTQRVIGRATAKELGEVLDESIKFQLDQISHTKEFYDIFDDILTNTAVGKGLSTEQISLAKRKALQSISEDIRNMDLPNMNKAFKAAGLEDLIDPVYFQTLNNVFKKPLNAGLRRLLNSFKKNVLATPHWIILNRVGNVVNNLIDGVTWKDYYDATLSGKYKKYIPDQLKSQTSFSSYLNEGLENVVDPASSIYKSNSLGVSVPINRLKRAKEKFNRSKGGLDDLTSYANELYTNTNDILANPIFKAESALELGDRYANYLSQAKRVSKATGIKLEDVLKEAKENPSVYNALNTEVNKALGDYTGRLYNLPSDFYNTLSEMVPFYRFYAQTIRTTAHQLANNPLRFQALAIAPTKVGRDKSKKIKKALNLSDEWYQGGVPYAIGGDGSIRTLGYEAIPIANVLGLAGDIAQGGDVTQLMHPLISSITPALMFQKFGKPATTPRADELAKTNTREAENFKPTMGERLRFLLNNSLGATSSWYNMARGWGREIGAGLIHKGLQSRYDTNPFTERPSSYKRQLPSELLFKQLGVRTYGNYPETKRSKSRTRKDLRKRKYFKQKEINANNPTKRL